MTTISALLDGEKINQIMEPNIGLSETLGEAIGEKEETSDSLEVKTILGLNQHVLGQPQLILGPMMLETKLNQKKKI